MIIGAHMIVYTTDAEADRAVFRDVLGLDHVDVGDGWLIFSITPAEVAFHPAEANGKHELFLTCPDVNATIKALNDHGISCSPVSDEGWGLLTEITLPSGSKLGVYQPKHEMPGS